MIKSNKPSLTQKMKNYLVGISQIEEKKPVARVGEIAETLGVKGSSAHVMVKMLADRNLVQYERYGYVNLTAQGKEIADQLREKNDIIQTFLMKYLGVDKKTAASDAREIKNTLSTSTFIKLKKFIYFLENRTDHRNINCPREVDDFSKSKTL